MSEFSVKVVQIEHPVVDHPNADRLSLVRIGLYTCIAAKKEDGTHRYQEGDWVVYVPEGAVVPESVLRLHGFWNDEQGKGVLSGSKGDRVKAKKLRDIFSQGILLPVEFDAVPPLGDERVGHYEPYIRVPNDARYEDDTLVFEEGWEGVGVDLGDDVSTMLCITKYEPPIPIALAGEVANIDGKTVKYDFESIQSIPDLFTPGEEVVATEKLHGTNCQIGYVPGLNNDELFFDGNLYVGSKGLSGRGLVFKDNEANDGNTYVQALRALLAQDFGEAIRFLSTSLNAPVWVFGEIYGAGVQKGFGYGQKAPAFAAFDIRVGNEYVPYDLMLTMVGGLGVAVVPTLYEGPYDLDAIEKVRDGKDSLSGSNLREGVVIKARDGGRHPHHGRKIGKWVSPAYLLKSTGEEFN